MNKRELENFVWFQFANDVDMDLRKRVSMDFAVRYKKAKVLSFNEFIKNKVYTIQEVWRARIKEDVRNINNNPSKNMAMVKLKQWQKISYVNDIVMNAYIKIMIELLDDNSSEAYIHLYKQLDKSTYNEAELGFEWQFEQDRLGPLFLALQSNALLHKDVTYDSFKKVLNSTLFTKIEPIKFICTNSLTIYLFDQLYKNKFINGKMLKRDMTIQQTTGIKNVAQKRAGYENYSHLHNASFRDYKPKGFEIVDNIIKDL